MPAFDSINPQTPARLGYRWPAEWEPHAASWLAWPHNRDTWPNNFAEVSPAFVQLIATLSAYEPVHVLAGGSDVMGQARSCLSDLSNVTFWDIKTNDAWARDFGPTFLRHAHSGETAVVDWQYNAWGGKYPPFDDDNTVAARIADQLQLRRFAPQLVLEGGAIEGNGQGLLITTTSCLLNANRNAKITRERAEWFLREYTSAGEVIWLEGAELAGDDTDGHVDQLVRFVAPAIVLVASEKDPEDTNFHALDSLRRQLNQLVLHDGSSPDVVTLPMPKPILDRGNRLPASYANFYIANDVVIVPQFGDPTDEEALEILRSLVKDRVVLGLDARALVAGLGAFHCLTQQQPA